MGQRVTKPSRLGLWAGIATAARVGGIIALLTVSGPLGLVYSVVWLMKIGRSNAIRSELWDYRRAARSARRLIVTSSGTSNEGLVELVGEGLRRQVVRRLRLSVILSTGTALTQVVAGAVWVSLLLSHFGWPPDTTWFEMWLASWWVAGVGALLVVSVPFSLQERCSIGSCAVSDLFLLELANASIAYRYWRPGCSRDKMKREQRVWLMSAACTARRLLPRNFNLSGDSGSGFRRIASELEACADEAVFSTGESPRRIGAFIVAGLTASATGTYGDMLKELKDTTAQHSSPKVFHSVVRAAFWFLIPAICIIAIDQFVPGRWPESISANWKSIAAVWALISFAKGSRTNLSDIAELLKPLLSKL